MKFFEILKKINNGSAELENDSFKIKSPQICLFLCLVIYLGCMLISMYPRGINVSNYSALAASKSGEKSKLTFDENVGVPVLVYHKIATRDKLRGVQNELVVTPEELENQLIFFKEQGFCAITYKELYEYMVNKSPIPQKSIVISFDDGFQSNYVYLPSLLRKYDMKAEIALVTGATRKFKGEVTNGASYFTWEHARQLQNEGYINMVSHTSNHINLPKCKNLQNELQGSSNDILQYIGIRPNIIVYPFGYYNDEVIKAAKSYGYLMGVTIERGVNYYGDDPMAVKRIVVSHGDTGEQILQKINGLKRK